MTHILLAASAKAFGKLFEILRDKLIIPKSDSKSFGPFSASYNLKLHLENGTIQLNDDDTVEVKNVNIVFDTLKVTLCFKIPGWCIPGFCLVPDPWNGCLVGIPPICIPPGGGSTICVGLDLSGLVSELRDLKARLVTKYFIDPARTPGQSDLDAEFAGHPNKWQIFLDPVWVHLDPINIPATVEHLLENAVKNEIDKLIPSWVPGWAKDLIWDIIGPILDVLMSGLGIVGSIADWLADLLGNQFDLLGFIETQIADYLASQYPLHEFEDPFPVLQGGGGLIPVKLPIRNLAAHVNSHEMSIVANVGA